MRYTNLKWLCILLFCNSVQANTLQKVQARIDTDLALKKPIIIHVFVALCDNKYQGIYPVPANLGNGQDPKNNLYWGALYGVKTFMPRNAGWTKLKLSSPSEDLRILERIVLYSELKRKDAMIPVYIVADAWNGAKIKDALQTYFSMLAGENTQKIPVTHEDKTIQLEAGSQAHLLAYLGHNGLMDAFIEPPTILAEGAPVKSAIVLSCLSKSYFLEALETLQVHPLLLTKGLMAPEAYTLDATIRSWVSDTRKTENIVEAAAAAYAQYQKSKLSAARQLFWGAP